MTFFLKTERLVLEDITHDDLEDLLDLARDREVMRWVLMPFDEDAQVKIYVEDAVRASEQVHGRKDYRLAIRFPGNRVFAGLAFLETDPMLKSTAEIGCILNRPFWKLGYAREITLALLRLGFEDLYLHRIYGKCDEQNRASVKALEGCGLCYEGTLREHVWLHDHWRSSQYFGILDSEYHARNVRKIPFFRLT